MFNDWRKPACMRAASTLGRQTLLEYPDAQGAFKMTQKLKEAKLEAHLEAVEAHKALLEKLHLNGNQHLDEVNQSLQALTLTLEEYLKLIGLP